MLNDHPVWSQVQDLEKLAAFEDFMKDLDRATYKQQKAARLRQERKRRETFKDMVGNLLQERKITHMTKWADFVQQYKKDAQYFDLVGQAYPFISSNKTDYSSANHFYGGSQPREIFADLIKDELKVLKKVKPIFRNLVKQNQIKF